MISYKNFTSKLNEDRNSIENYKNSVMSLWKLHMKNSPNTNHSSEELNDIASGTKNKADLMYVANHKNTHSDTLHNMAKNSDDEDIHAMISANENTSSKTLKYIKSNTDDEDIHYLISVHKNK